MLDFNSQLMTSNRVLDWYLWFSCRTNVFKTISNLCSNNVTWQMILQTNMQLIGQRKSCQDANRHIRTVFLFFFLKSPCTLWWQSLRMPWLQIDTRGQELPKVFEHQHSTVQHSFFSAVLEFSVWSEWKKDTSLCREKDKQLTRSVDLPQALGVGDEGKKKNTKCSRIFANDESDPPESCKQSLQCHHANFLPLLARDSRPDRHVRLGYVWEWVGGALFKKQQTNKNEEHKTQKKIVSNYIQLNIFKKDCCNVL